MKKEDREYWSIKNRIGYCVISGDTKKREELEKELETFLERETNGKM